VHGPAGCGPSPASGARLHFEVRIDGTPVNPMGYL
jgi:murein DD-endopeptidase MepM/ murein hydrolase activator NlpD